MFNLFNGNSKIQRNTRIRLYKKGGFTGGLTGIPIDMTLDKLPKKEFETAKEILNTLKFRWFKMIKYSRRNRDYGYVVEVGKNTANANGLTTIFKGNPHSKTPVIIEQLESILQKLAEQEDMRLKP